RAQGLPEALLLRGITEVVGADQPLKAGAQLYPLHLQGQGIAVCVGDQHHLAATALQRLEEEVRIGSQLDQMRNLPLQLDDRQIKLAGPEVEAVPVQLTPEALQQRKDPFPGPLL